MQPRCIIMNSDVFKSIKMDVDRLVDEYVKDTADFDRIFNLRRRVLDCGIDAVPTLLLHMVTYAKNKGFIFFAKAIIRDILSYHESHSGMQGDQDSRAVAAMLGRIVELRKNEGEAAAHGVEETLVLLAAFSIWPFKAARKLGLPAGQVSILENIIARAKQAVQQGFSEKKLNKPGFADFVRNPRETSVTFIKSIATRKTSWN